MPSCRAASTLAWPAIRPPSSPTSAGLVQPHSLMLAAMASDLGIRVGPGIFGVWDQPIDPPPLDRVGRPRPLISGSRSRAGARTCERGSVGAFTQCRRAGDILDFQKMEQDRPILVRIHRYRAKAGMDLLGDCIGDVRFKNSAGAAQQIERQQIGDRGAVREASSFHPSHPPVSDLPAEFGKKPRLADAGFADEPDGLSMPVFDLPEEIVQDRKFACRRRTWRMPAYPWPE
jgi:hypothetical protein